MIYFFIKLFNYFKDLSIINFVFIFKLLFHFNFNYIFQFFPFNLNNTLEFSLIIFEIFVDD
jgi:hypothetical protein